MTNWRKRALSKRAHWPRAPDVDLDDDSLPLTPRTRAVQEQYSSLARRPCNVRAWPSPTPRSALVSNPQRQRVVGIALMMLAVSCFSCLDATAKYVNRSVDPLVTVWARYIVSVLLTSVMINPWTRPGVMRTNRLGLQLLRSTLMLFTTDLLVHGAEISSARGEHVDSIRDAADRRAAGRPDARRMGRDRGG